MATNNNNKGDDDNNNNNLWLNISTTKVSFKSSTQIINFSHFVSFLYPFSFLVTKQEKFRPPSPPFRPPALAFPSKREIGEKSSETVSPRAENSGAL